ncbi:hypothetical protein GLOIN_2v1879755 [Rhizophagus irregularis DAOM 181602=DAOM 197198]|uniref:Uncharacterized protein n=1 Tax=Rhizophagus irregularis (strain DAOM 181602 / DAOM 197198 / MUCL 43194) TaxID=747089 RepID=A0A2P4PME9_RHIID|nr:hypothetical protein GLOIN_2v1879755 [Rhizophagus irregularis DAOM 181602=DAOM 197198]POG66561.1 hypothetical protein GLOIN_2v1879755 [Rhizophagus irregularis DAOM 181602=DAOM 197198]GBC41986.2 hypothetical protein GLOIN_2v1879755 [Rhizophagus irregularis DAOM 181602=DAOM 197198]|eukprot:XP_025173427.1 hypothetical protein GLOIN_2v1879755 [Rhizophagus irregularis DAOM 181602=DAOM 197198]
MSRNRKVCQNCRSKVIVTPTPPPQNVFKNFNQVTSEVGYKMLIDDIFINHSFNEEHFLELRKKKDASFERKDSKLAEQSSSAGQSATIDNIFTDLQEMEISGQDNVAPWQEILNR